MYMQEEAHLFGSFFNFVENNDMIRSEQESAPRHLKFSKDGRYLYIVHELKNYIDVYTYEEVDGNPEFEKIQTVSTGGSSSIRFLLQFCGK